MSAVSSASDGPRPEREPAPRQSARPRARAVGIAVCVGASVLLVAGACIVLLTRPTSPPVAAAEAQVDQCIEDPSVEKPMVVDCSSARAAYKVTSRAEGTPGPWSSGSSCIGVPGSDTAYENLCLIDVHKDPDAAVNTVAVGDCLTIDDPDAKDPEVSKAECGPGAYPVLAVLRDADRLDVSTSGITSMSGSAGVCDDAGVEASSVYGWSLTRYQRLTDRRSSAYDLAFCLGEPQPGGTPAPSHTP